MANPVGQIWSGAMMLDHLGYGAAAHEVVDVIEEVLASGVRTPDLGGDAGTGQVTAAVLAALAARPDPGGRERGSGPTGTS